MSGEITPYLLSEKGKSFSAFRLQPVTVADWLGQIKNFL